MDSFIQLRKMYSFLYLEKVSVGEMFRETYCFIWRMRLFRKKVVCLFRKLCVCLEIFICLENLFRESLQPLNPAPVALKIPSAKAQLGLAGLCPESDGFAFSSGGG